MTLKKFRVTDAHEMRSGSRPLMPLRFRDSLCVMARCSKTVLSFLQSKASGSATEKSCPGPEDSFNTMMRSAFGYGSGRSRTALITLKMTVLALMLRPSVITATAVKPGCFVSMRNAYRKSCTILLGELFAAKSDDRIELGGATCAQETGDKSYDGKGNDSEGKRRDVERADTIK